MADPSFETVSGVKVVALVFGFIGAALGISYTPQITKKAAVAALASGIVCGGLGPSLLAWAFNWHLPATADNALAFVCGVGGMFIIPGLIAAWQGFAHDPWGFIDRLRGIAKRDDKP